MHGYEAGGILNVDIQNLSMSDNNTSDNRVTIGLDNGLLPINLPDSKVHEAYMGPTWGWQDPGGPMLATWTLLSGLFRTV